MGFRLDKWYLDGVTDAGEALIVYRADLTLAAGLPTIRYAALLHHDAATGKTRTTTSLRPAAAPDSTPAGDRVTYREPRLTFHGTWTRLQPPHLDRPLYRDAHGEIEWCCHQPAARFEGSIDGKAIAGRGYVERLRMTIPPWRLPIDELHWGRVMTSRGAIVWIEWRGPHPLQRVLLPGGVSHTRDARIEADRLSIGDGTEVTVDRGVVLRDGPLGTTVLSRIPLLAKTAPAQILAARETKWLSRAQVRFNDGASEDGCMAIHEVVRWRA